ncbi:MAG: bifunctional metallophosphatase/5'-nucleotidase [Anaerolineales bacterium]|nr:bifunctional metallophosphatase/5'-nucleotidase [Anaerolineales bacterium]
MSKRIIALVALGLLLAACVAPTPAPTPTPAGPLTVTIFHTNDMHGYLEGQKIKGGDGVEFEFGGVANAMGTIVRLKQESPGPALLFDTGDLWVGTFASNRDQGKTIFAAMNAMGYDAMTLGNHDFDQGVAVVQARAAEAKFPILIANIIEASTGKVPAWAKAYIVKEIGGVRFGIVGVSYTRTPGISSKVKELQAFKFVDELEALKQILPEVKSKSDLIVVLSHAGFDTDQRIAAALPEINVIVGGHTHTELRNPKVIGSTIIVQAGSRAQNVGRLDLTIDRASKKITDYSKSNVLFAAVSNKAQTPKEIAEMVTKLIADGRAATQKVIGETAIDLTRAYTADGRSTGEYPSGNLVVDAMLWAKQAGDAPADLAIHNNAGIRADIPKGSITYGQLFEMLPFDNVLVAMDLKGEHIKAVLEVAVSCPRANTLVAGMSFTYNCALPSGNRVSNILIQGKPIDLQKMYRVQTIDYLATGGDGQAAFKEGTNLIYGEPVIDVVAAYVTKNSPVNPKVQGRIVEAK